MARLLQGVHEAFVEWRCEERIRKLSEIQFEEICRQMRTLLAHFRERQIGIFGVELFHLLNFADHGRDAVDADLLDASCLDDFDAILQDAWYCALFAPETNIFCIYKHFVGLLKIWLLQSSSLNDWNNQARREREELNLKLTAVARLDCRQICHFDFWFVASWWSSWARETSLLCEVIFHCWDEPLRSCCSWCWCRSLMMMRWRWWRKRRRWWVKLDSLTS